MKGADNKVYFNWTFTDEKTIKQRAFLFFYLNTTVFHIKIYLI